MFDDRSSSLSPVPSLPLSSSLSPPPEISRCRAKETISPAEELKHYLKAGMYSVTHRTAEQNDRRARECDRRPKSTFAKGRSRRHLGILPLPVCWGRQIIEQEREFFLPYDLAQWAVSKSRDEYLERVRAPIPYVKLKHNILYERPRYRERDIPICSCRPPSDGSLTGCGEDCINRMMQYECHNDQCPCGVQCSNQVIQRRAGVAALEVFFTGKRGFGLRTRSCVKAGEFVIEYRGEIMERETYWKRLAGEYNSSNKRRTVDVYALDYEQGEIIDATRKGTEARFINHSCGPNCHIQKWYFAGEYLIGVFASRDIEAGEELTYDYGFSYWTKDETVSTTAGGQCNGLSTGAVLSRSEDQISRKQRCLCGANQCSGWIGVRARKSVAKDPGLSRSKARGRKQKPRKGLQKRKPLAELRNIV